MNETLCWGCKHAVPATDKRTGRQTAGCEWSLYRCKVPGWVARETIQIVSGKRLTSFEVLSCPRFERG
ncbi:MAG: hypothetical protein IJM75_06225 [Ruminococcus sp.]|nr:hypothetical protein [Ruminococcus sp.]